MERYEYIVIGSGAGGAAATHRLAGSGARVLVLERGERLPLDGSTLEVAQVFREGRFKGRDPWVNGQGTVITPEEYFNLGGKTMWYGAALIRFAPHEFEADPGHQCLAWPIGHADLEPYYREAEALLGVRTFPIEADLRRLLDGIETDDRGWEEHPLPLGLAPEVLEDPREARHFDGFASVRGYKADTQRRVWEPLAGRDHVTVLTGKEVVRLIPSTGSSRAVDGVLCRDGSEYRADRVLLAAGALHSPRLLEAYVRAHGLGPQLPGSDLIGRNYKFHLNSAVLAVSTSRKHDLLRKTVLLFHPDFPHSSVQTLGWLDGEIVGAQLPAFVPPWVAGLLGSRAYGLWVTTEDGSVPDNRVRAADGGALAHPQIDYDRRRVAVAVAEHRRVIRRLRGTLARRGHAVFARGMPLVGTAHACGTLVTGADPARSVVDPEGRVHGMENLYAVDGSVLPRSSRVNPALTIYAWALRVADRLVAAAGRKEAA